MAGYALFFDGELEKNLEGLDIEVRNLTPINNVNRFIEKFRKNSDYIEGCSVDDLLKFFQKLSELWNIKGHSVQQFNALGLPFLIQWLRLDNLKRICDLSIRNNRLLLDEFIRIGESDKFVLKAHPKGLVGHWIAGNIPILGMISLVQGMLTKNLNIIRVSESFGNILPVLLNSFQEIEFKNSNGNLVSGKELAKCIAVIYYDKGDQNFGQDFSRNLDVRVVWGGREAVEAIMGLPKSIDSTDIIFGPKYSFAIVDHHFLENDQQIKEISQRLAFDISAFEQRGCNSPHTVFVEKGGKIGIEAFCNILGEALQKALRLFPKEKIDSGTVSKILNARAEYGFEGKIVCSKGTEWTVLFSPEKNGIAEPCFGRTIFVREVDNIFDIEKYVNHHHQSVGLAVGSQRKLNFADRLFKKGVVRCPDIGSMSLYEIPWDGMFPMEKMIRWSYVYN